VLAPAQSGSFSMAQRTRGEQVGLGAFPGVMAGAVTIVVTKTARDGTAYGETGETPPGLQPRSHAISGDRLDRLGRRSACS
jgi:hypothetical protein